MADDETYETHYGLRDPIIDVFCRSYLHVWTMKGGHVRFVTYTEHTAKCKTDTIPKWSSQTRLTHSTGGRGQEDRVFVKSTNPKEELFMKYAHTGRPCPFETLWYDELISMSTESLDSMAFGPETIQICATQIYSEKLSLPAEEVSFYTPSDTWCYWFM